MASRFATIAALGVAGFTLSASAATNDACTLLTAADVGAALNAPAGVGEPITPADHKLCTWRATDGHSWVTLLLQASQTFDSGKALYANAKGGNGMLFTPVSGVGNDAFFLAVGDQVGLIVKKGGVAFKVAVYQHGPVGPKQMAERTLAGKIVPRL